MFVRYLNLFNKHMSGTSYGMMGVILGTMIGNYKRDLQSNVLYYHPFTWWSVVGGLCGYYLGWKMMPLIRYP